MIVSSPINSVQPIDPCDVFLPLHPKQLDRSINSEKVTFLCGNGDGESGREQCGPKGSRFEIFLNKVYCQFEGQHMPSMKGDMLGKKGW